ncbi:hypothetical protein LCUFL03_300060 [Latilactobacillus curvatus]|nr:hypothetical protein LCUFL03_300060 [Latilactobacillus curvatus]
MLVFEDSQNYVYTKMLGSVLMVNHLCRTILKRIRWLCENK